MSRPRELPLNLLQRTLRSQLGQNILTNYLAVVWMGGLTLGLIPFYLRGLGSEQWGVVALCIAIQGFFGLVDAGLGQIMPRDVARVSGDARSEARVFHVFSQAYLTLGMVGFAIGQLTVPLLVEHWFNQGQGLASNAPFALRLVLVQFFFQFANNANVGFWNGMQAQATANLRQCAFATCKHAGALLAVFTWRSDAVAYLVPFAAVSLVEWWLNRRAIERSLRGLGDAEPPLTLADFRLLGQEAGVLAAGVLIGMLVTQIDRIVLSRTVDVSAFGRYVIVANLGTAFMQLQGPLMRAYFPRLAREDESGDKTSLKQLALALFTMAVLPCLLVIAWTPQILRAWLADERTVTDGTMPLRLILVAASANALFQLVYQYILRRGEGRLIVVTNLTALVVIAPATVILSKTLGVVAGGLSWLMLSAFQWLFALLWLRRVVQIRPT